MTQRCRVCGCSNFSACAGGCWWVEDDLCSACAAAMDVATGSSIALEELGTAAFPGRLPVQAIELADGTVMRAHSDGSPETIAALRQLGEAMLERLRSEGR